MGQDTVRGRTLRVVLGTALVTAALVGSAGYFMLRGEALREAHEVNAERAARIANQVRTTVDDGARTLEEVAGSAPVRSLDPDALDRALDLALRAQPLFHSIYVYGAAGKVVYRRYRDGTRDKWTRSASLDEKDDVPFRTAAHATLDDAQPRILPLRRNRGGSLFVPCIVAIPGEGRPAGLLSGAISAGGPGFAELIEGLPPGAGGWIGLFQAGPERDPLAWSHARGLPWSSVSRGAASLEVQVLLQDLGLVVRVGLPRAEAMQDMPRAAVRLALVSLVALVLGGALGVVLSRHVTDPLEELVRGIRRVETGDLGHRIPVQGEDEVAEVSRAFNRLAESLARHELVRVVWEELEEGDDADPAAPPEPATPDDPAEGDG